MKKPNTGSAFQYRLERVDPRSCIVCSLDTKQPGDREQNIRFDNNQ